MTDTNNTTTNLNILSKFIGTRSYYGKQNADGSYKKISSQLTNLILLSHLEYKSTIGTYLLSYGKYSKILCFDIDVHVVDDDDLKIKSLDIVTRIVNYLNSIQFNPILEASGTPNSFHVWLLFDDKVEAKVLRIFAKSILQLLNINTSDVEIFPKQDKVEKGKIGNLIKLPLGVNQKNGNISKIISGNLTHTETIKMKEWREDVNNIININSNKNIRPCFKIIYQSMLQLSHGDGHYWRTAIGNDLLREMNIDESIAFFKYQDDFDPNVTKYQLESLKGLDNPHSCMKLKENCLEVEGLNSFPLNLCKGCKWEYVKVANTNTVNEKNVHLNNCIIDNLLFTYNSNNSPYKYWYEVNFGIKAFPHPGVLLSKYPMSIGMMRGLVREAGRGEIPNLDDIYKSGMVENLVKIFKCKYDPEKGSWVDFIREHKKRLITFYIEEDTNITEDFLRNNNILKLLLPSTYDKMLLVYLANGLFQPECVPNNKSEEFLILAQSRPHGIILKPTKTGISSTAELIGIKSERQTIASLTGFNMPKKEESFRGVLSTSTTPYLMDEFLEKPENEQLTSAFLDYLERGNFISHVGKTVEIHSLSTISFASNIDKNKSLQSQLAIVMEKFTKNFIGLGSRFGFLWLNSKGTPISHDRKLYDIGEFTYEFIKLAKGSFTKYILQHDDWLNTPHYNDWYDVVEEIANKTDIVDGFVRSIAHGYTHINGGCLRYILFWWVVEDPTRLLLDEWDLDLESDFAKRYTKEYYDLLLEQLRNLQTVLAENVGEIGRTEFAFDRELEKLKDIRDGNGGNLND